MPLLSIRIPKSQENIFVQLGQARAHVEKYQFQHTLIHLLFVTMIHVEKAIPMSHKIHGCRPPPQKHDREKKEFPKKGSFVRRLPIFVHNKLPFRKLVANQRNHENGIAVISDEKWCHFPVIIFRVDQKHVKLIVPQSLVRINLWKRT